MIFWQIEPSMNLAGNIRPPSSKSQALRAILFAAVASSPSKLFDVPKAKDAKSMIIACERLGAKFYEKEGYLYVEPIQNMESDTRDLLIDCGNSGIVWRFVAAIASLRPGCTLMTGDDSILFRRPIETLLAPLRALGAEAWQPYPTGGPAFIRGSWKSNAARSITVNGMDSQPVSALLIASSLQNQDVEIFVEHPREVPWAMLTVSWLCKRGVKVNFHDPSSPKAGTYYQVIPSRWRGEEYHVPVDFSCAAFIIAMALVTRSTVRIRGLCYNDPQPDRVLIDWLLQSRAHLHWVDEILYVDGSHPYMGIHQDFSGPIDLLPIVATLACFASTPSTFTSISGARLKESDRVEAITSELKKMGAQISLDGDEMHVEPRRLHGAHLSSHKDHRIAMSLAVAAMGATSQSQVDNVQWVDKTYPDFASDVSRLGATLIVGSTI